MLNNYITPLIERLASGDISLMNAKLAQQVYERRRIAQCVVEYFRVAQSNENILLGAKTRYYQAIAALLKNPDYRRILLYLPLADLKRCT